MRALLHWVRSDIWLVHLPTVRFQLILLTLSAVGLSTLAFPALATPPLASPSQLCEAAIVAAERAERLPERMMGAIALVETGRADPTSGAARPWPWTINAEGQGFFFASKQQAIEAVRALQARGVRSIDVGCMQVNLMFHPAAFHSLDEAFDPGANAQYAARFLNALYAGSHDWKSAIGAYHSQTQALGEDYRKRVLALWRDPSANWHLGLAVAYRDFAGRAGAYNDFEPRSAVYGAFAPPADAPPGAPLGAPSGAPLGADRGVTLRR